MFRRIHLMQQADAAGGGTGAAAGAGVAAGPGAGAGAAGAAGADKNGQQQQTGQQGKTQEGAASSQAGTQQDTTKGAQSTEAAKGAGTKAGDQAQLVIKLPSESKADPKLVEAYTAHAKKLGMTQEAAQGAWDWFSQAQAEGAKAFEGALQKQVVKEVDALKADKEFGGVNYDKTIAARTYAGSYFYGEEAMKRWEKEGVISFTDPDFQKGLARSSRAVSGSSVGDKGGQPAPAMTTREAELRRMFPNSYDAMVGKPQQKKTA